MRRLFFRSALLSFLKWDDHWHCIHEDETIVERLHYILYSRTTDYCH